jgi:1-acyl-sn-glycerol-3-phosphate acyltransferase
MLKQPSKSPCGFCFPYATHDGIGANKGASPPLIKRIFNGMPAKKNGAKSVSVLIDLILALWMAVTTIVYTLMLGLGVIVLRLFSGSSKPPYQIARLWAWLMLKTNGVKIKIEGLEKIQPDRSYVFMSNHLSHLDPLPVIWMRPHPLCFVAKKSLEKIPIFGWGARQIGVIFIDRSDTPQAIARINQTIKELKGGVSAYFFAEGTRGIGGKLQPFKKGGVVLALKAGLPLVPITFLDSHKLFPKKALRIKHGTMRVIVDDPIDTSGCGEKEKDLLLEKVRSAIAENLRRHEGI